jgi:hypothetical protein
MELNNSKRLGLNPRASHVVLILILLNQPRKRRNNCIKTSNHERPKSRTWNFTNIETLNILFVVHSTSQSALNPHSAGWYSDIRYLNGASASLLGISVLQCLIRNCLPARWRLSAGRKTIDAFPLLSFLRFVFVPLVEKNVYLKLLVIKLCLSTFYSVDCVWYVMAHGDAREGKWRGNWRMEWVTSKRHMTAEHRLARAIQTLQDDVHSSTASSRLNWRPCRLKWTRPFRRKTKSGFCASDITFQTKSTRPLTWSSLFRLVRCLIFSETRRLEIASASVFRPRST